MIFFKKLKDFIQQVAQDERIPGRDKKIILGLLALLISPFDIIPDWIPIFGVLDDVMIIAIILDYFFRVLDSRILLSHYPWGMKSFSQLRWLARISSFLVPNFIKKKLWSYVGDPY
jgi:uncharacterized membrane protein YkvA (DUF1232 family)